jgi:hypothetical protein
VSWLVTTGWIAGGLGAAIDGALLAFHGAPGRALVASAAMAWSFGVWVGALAAATIGVCGALLARIGSTARRASLDVGLSSLAALVCATFVVQPWRHGIVEPYWVIIVLTAAVVALLVWLARAQPRAQARVFALLLALPPLGMDIWLAPSAYPELHDLALLVAGAALASAFSDARAALADGRWKHTWSAAFVMLAAALAIHHGSEWFAPGHRAFSLHEGRHAVGWARTLHRVVDLDRDGFSPLPWGGDCDDFDPARHPRAAERSARRDLNCNSVVKPERPRARDLGLGPLRGDPALARGAVDLVVLITIDTLRADAFTPALLPRTFAALPGAAHFDRAYAAGPNTAMAMPSIHKPQRGAPFVAETLKQRGIDTRAVVSAHWFPPGDFGFARFEDSAGAARVTRALLAHLPAASARPMLLWGHYSEPHAPRTLHPGLPVPNGPAHLPPDYRGALAYLDRELAPLLTALAARDGLARTVLIVTSDHGEGLGEHGIDGHGRSGYEEIVAIPALLHAPGMPAGHYAQLVSQRDLPATILGAFGLHDETRAAEAFGRSWLRLRSDPKLVLHEHVVLSSMRFSSGRYGAVPLWVLVGPRFKLVASFDDGVAELFDRETDPRERQDLTLAHPAVARDLRRALARYTDIERVPPALARLP